MRKISKYYLLVLAALALLTTIVTWSVGGKKGGFSGVVDFKQLATVPESEWIGSILQRSNSEYYEGMSVPQRVIFLDIASTPGDVHTLTFSHEATKGGIHAYDWLTAWNQGNDPLLVFDPWGPKIGPPKNLGDICRTLHEGPNDYLVDVPDDAFMSKDGSTQNRINAYELEFGNRQIRICGNQPITSASFTNMYHDVHDGGDTDDSYIHYELTWTSTSDQILIEMAGHLAMSGDPSTNPIAWGPGLGSSQIQGGPYHFKLHELDELSLGSQDNQIMGTAILMVPGRKAGYKWNDMNGDGIWDTDEPGLEGWTIELWKDGSLIDTDVTDADGYYEFTDLELGTYRVQEVLQSGWIQTYPAAGYHEFTVISGFEELENNFGNFKLGEKGGYKYDDVTGDGPAGTNLPLSDWTINLYKWDGAAWVFQEYDDTDEFGYYEFAGLEVGTYKVEETLQDGWICTYPDPPYYEFTVTSGFSETNNNFYNFKLGKKGGYKWNDLDGNGVWDTGEIGLSGWTIQLWKDGVLFDIYVTEADGYYEFTDLTYGDYVVKEVLQSSWICTYPDPPHEYTFICTSGFEELDNNFGNFKLGVKGGYKYEDITGDGPSGDDTPLPGWTIELKDATGNVIATTVTDSQGYYEFKDLYPGTYTVQEVLQDGWIQTYGDSYTFTVTSGFSETDNNFYNFKLGVKAGYKWNDLDGDGVKEDGEPVLDGWTIKLYLWDGTTWVWQADAITGDGAWPDGYYEFTDLEAGAYRVQEVLHSGWIQTYPAAGHHQFTVISGFEDLDNNFGNFKLGVKAGYKYEDITGNGPSADDTPLEGWTINLYKWDGAAWVFQKSDITDASGYYEFIGLEPGTYKVQEVLKDGWVCTHPDPPYHEFTVTAGFSETENNFYNFKLGVKAGYKWNDLDGDGVWDTGEPGLAGWTIELWKDGSLFDTYVTAADGYYEFKDLYPGTYTVQEVLQDGWIQTYGDSYTFTCISGFEDLDNNFGNFKLGVKGGYKWNDIDGDGVKEDGEPALDGWTIDLYWWDGTTWVWQADVVTGDGDWPDGYYEFTGLEAGAYRVQEVLQTGWIQTYPAAGYHEFTVISGFLETENNFGNFLIPPEYPPSFDFKCYGPITDAVRVGEIKTYTFIATNIGDPESRIYYLTFTAVIKDYHMLQFVDPYTAKIKVYYNDGTTWEAYVDGVLTHEKFSGFGTVGDYWMVTWRVPTTYPDGPYLEGNDQNTLEARAEISFRVKGVAYGETWLELFPRATEDHHLNGVPLADITDKANIWEGGDLWYPVHNSYDPYDDTINSGHSFTDGSWNVIPTTNEYAKVRKLTYILY